jgi:hypothetical protein
MVILKMPARSVVGGLFYDDLLRSKFLEPLHANSSS